MKNEHGGRRLGAGRKLKFGQQTTVVRLPVDFVEEVKKLDAEDLKKMTMQLRVFNSRKNDSNQ